MQERERQFEIDIRRAKGYEVKRMMEDGNCLFRAVADQVYGDPEAHDLVRQMCMDYMVRCVCLTATYPFDDLLIWCLWVQWSYHIDPNHQILIFQTPPNWGFLGWFGIL